jgi:hypothetical protein
LVGFANDDSNLHDEQNGVKKILKENLSYYFLDKLNDEFVELFLDTLELLYTTQLKEKKLKIIL